MKIAIDFGGIYGSDGIAGGIVSINSGLTLADIITSLYPYIYALAGFALFLYLVIGGFEFLVSGGDQNKIQSGKSKITNALVGFLILFLAYWIVQLIGTVLNVSLINSLFGN